MPVATWVAEPKATDQWSRVAALRSGAEAARSKDSVPALERDAEIHAEGTHLHEEH